MGAFGNLGKDLGSRGCASGKGYDLRTKREEPANLTREDQKGKCLDSRMGSRAHVFRTMDSHIKEGETREGRLFSEGGRGLVQLAGRCLLPEGPWFILCGQVKITEFHGHGLRA